MAPRRCMLVAAGAATVVLNSWTATAGPGYDHLLVGEQEIADHAEKLADTDIAACVIDVSQAAISVGLAGVSIDGAAQVCPDGTTASCLTGVTAVINSIGWVASYVAYAANDCKVGLDVNAVCAGDITDVFACLAEMISAGALLSESCGVGPGPDVPVERRLSSSGKNNKWQGLLSEKAVSYPEIKATRRWANVSFPEATRMLRTSQESLRSALLAKGRDTSEVDRMLTAHHGLYDHHDHTPAPTLSPAMGAACGFNIAYAASYLARVGLTLKTVQEPCQAGEDGKIGCLGGITGIISSFAWIATYVAYAVTTCGAEDFQSSNCAAGISELIACTASIISASSSMASSCKDAAEGVTPTLPPQFQ